MLIDVENPMMRLTLVKPYRLVVADDPPKNYLWHQRELGLTRSAFGRLKYTHTGYTACLLIQGASQFLASIETLCSSAAMGITQSHTRLTDRARAFLDGIAQKLNKAWILEVQLPHLRRALVSAEPSSYTSILEAMHQLDLADEKDLQAVEGGNSPTARRSRYIITSLDTDVDRCRAERRSYLIRSRHEAKQKRCEVALYHRLQNRRRYDLARTSSFVP